MLYEVITRLPETGSGSVIFISGLPESVPVPESFEGDGADSFKKTENITLPGRKPVIKRHSAEK